MNRRDEEQPPKKGKKVRVAMRRNRAKPPRLGDWTRKARESEGNEVDSVSREMVVSKGDQSRRRTIIVPEANDAQTDLGRGIVINMHGLYTQVDTGTQIIPCAVPRMLRTRLIKERHPVTVGDWVRFRLERARVDAEPNGVIDSVEPRRGQLQRRVEDRIQTVVANVDQAILVSSADDPPPKPNLIDRYIVAALSGGITPVICMNKMDIDRGGCAKEIVERYDKLGYVTLGVSATRGDDVDRFREVLKDKSSVVAGQSGVGKSSLLNAVQPELGLKVGAVTRDTQKGRHTTTAATLIRLNFGGFVVDTPGVRAFELASIDRRELEVHFVEFVPHVPNCKFPDCSHTHETDCAVKAALEREEIHPERYESYVRLFEEGSTPTRHATR